MKFVRLRFSGNLQSSDNLNAFWSTRLRGALGYYLKLLFCDPHSFKYRCMLPESCVFHQMFESEQKKWRISSVVIPKSPDIQLKFDIFLFDENVAFAPFVIFAIERMGLDGIGSRWPTKFSIQQVELVDALGQHIRDLYFQGACRFQPDMALNVDAPLPPTDFYRIILRTPVRLKSSNQLVTDLSGSNFGLLLHRQEEKLSDNHRYFNPNDICVQNSQLQWMEHERYSTRQGASMRLGGLTGFLDLVVHDNHESVAKALWRSQVYGLGKATTFGFGDISIHPLYKTEAPAL